MLLIGGIVAAAVFVFWPRRAWPEFVFPAAVGIFLVLSSYPIVGTLRDYSRNLKAAAGLQQQASWVDTSLGPGQQASFLLGTTSDYFTEATELSGSRSSGTGASGRSTTSARPSRQAVSTRRSR